MTDERYLTVGKMPRLEVVMPDSDGVLRQIAAPSADLAGFMARVAEKRPSTTAFFLSPQRFLQLRSELAPPGRWMHVQPLHDDEGLIVKAAVEILGVPVFEDDTRLDHHVNWTEEPA